jgi:hypothetical protein
VFLVAGLGVTISLVHDVPRRGIPDAESGLGLTASVGGGITAGPFVFEVRTTAAPGGRLTSFPIASSRKPRPSGVRLAWCVFCTAMYLCKAALLTAHRSRSIESWRNGTGSALNLRTSGWATPSPSSRETSEMFGRLP